MDYESRIQEILDDIDADYSPAVVEALMRAGNRQGGTLDHLVGDSFRAEVKATVRELDHSPVRRGVLGNLAESYGLA